MEDELAVSPALNTPKEFDGTTILCCEDVSSVITEGSKKVITNRVKEIIESLVTEFKFLLTKGRPLKEAPYTPEKFPYVVQVILHIPSDEYPNLQLVPERPWRWFVPCDASLVRMKDSSEFDLRRCVKNYRPPRRNWVEIESSDIPNGYSPLLYKPLKQSMKYTCAIEGHDLEWSFQLLDPRNKCTGNGQDASNNEAATMLAGFNNSLANDIDEESMIIENENDESMLEEVIAGSKGMLNWANANPLENYNADYDGKGNEDKGGNLRRVAGYSRTGRRRFQSEKFSSFKGYEIQDEEVSDKGAESYEKEAGGGEGGTKITGGKRGKAPKGGKKRKTKKPPGEKEWMPRGRRPSGFFEK